MNNRVTINPKEVIKYNFKHIFSYRLLYHIMAYYDTDSNRVFIDSQDICSKYNVSNYSVSNAIKELLSYNIISSYKYYKRQYIINKNIFIKFSL